MEKIIKWLKLRQLLKKQTGKIVNKCRDFHKVLNSKFNRTKEIDHALIILCASRIPRMKMMKGLLQKLD